MNKFAYLVAASALAVSAFGQGQINLNNRGLALVNDASGKPLTGTSFVAQVWYGASASSLTKSFAPSPFRASTTTYPGTWNPAATGGPGAIATLDGFAPSGTDTREGGIPHGNLQGHGAARSETVERRDRARTAGGGRIPGTRVGGRGSAERRRSERLGQRAGGSTVPDLSDEAGAGQRLARRVIDQSQTAVVEVDLSLTEGRNSQRRGGNEVSELVHGIFC